MTGFTHYNDGEKGEGRGRSQEEEAGAGGLEELAQLGRKIGGEVDSAVADQLARDFAEFLKSRGAENAAAETVKPESLFTRLDRIRKEDELARAAQQSELVPGAVVGRGPAGHTTDGASSRHDGNPRGEAGKGADDQRSDDPG
jgi:hypothetical protein